MIVTSLRDTTNNINSKNNEKTAQLVDEVALQSQLWLKVGSVT